MSEQLLSFDEFGLSDQVKQALGDLKFETPTEVQSATFHPILEGLDLMVQARTGTGKTAAFAIPLVDRLLREERKVQVLILCPTRELALQVSGEMEALGRHKSITVVPIYGGASMTKQLQQLEEGVTAVVGTPGRVLDHLWRRTLVVDDVRVLVLDEADEMLSMGFEKEISAIIEELPKQRQTLLFSATIPPEIQRLAQRYLNEPRIISLSDDYVGAKEVQHAFYMVSGTGRLNDLIRIIDTENPDSAMIFCNTREDVQVVASGLKRHGFDVDWISSDLSQTDRELAMGHMRDGTARFLVATDVAARGIDISHVTHVINFTFPEALEVYIHRTGRTGRMGRTGFAISLITPRDVGNLYFLRLTYRIHPIERELPTEGELAALRESDLLRTLVSEYRAEIDGECLSLARRVVNHVHGLEIVATLLGKVLTDRKAASDSGQQVRRSRRAAPPESVKDDSPPPTSRVRTRREAGETGRGGRRSRATEATERRQPVGEQPGVEIAAPVASAETEQPRDADAPGEPAEIREIYLNVGRRDGVRRVEIERLLDGGGVPREHVDKVRVRDRSTFVGVRAELQAAALAALDGARFGDRVVLAEPAKRSKT
jgi:ATP-dependent RNA helicase DeaD